MPCLLFSESISLIYEGLIRGVWCHPCNPKPRLPRHLVSHDRNFGVLVSTAIYSWIIHMRFLTVSFVFDQPVTVDKRGLQMQPPHHLPLNDVAPAMTQEPILIGVEPVTPPN